MRDIVYSERRTIMSSNKGIFGAFVVGGILGVYVGYSKARETFFAAMAEALLTDKAIKREEGN